MKALHRWRPALRIARRDARRAKGRSLLVIAMIALPVLGVGAADVLYRTFQLTEDQKLTRGYGAAHVAITDTGQASIEQVYSRMDRTGWGGDAGPRTGAAPSVSSVLPPGSRYIADAYGTQVTVVAGGRSARVDLRSLPYTDPLAEGIYRQVSGRAPTGIGELVLTTALAERLGISVGDPLHLARVTAPATVVGIVEGTRRSDEQTALVDPALLKATVRTQVDANVQYLVEPSRPLTWADVERANQVGYLLSARTPVSGAPPEQVYDSNQEAVLTAVALVVGMALLEIVLLAGPAFAVGAKRQQRHLALLQATGAQRSDVGRVVLSSGLVLGALGAIVGVVLAVGLAAAAVPMLVDLRNELPGPFEVRVLELGAIAAVGVGIAVLAALIPARNAARQDPLAGLTGRRGVVRSKPWLPLLGTAAALIGAVVAYQGALSRSVNTILGGSILAELGLVAVTPFLVGQIGRLGPLFPVAPRLALRDAARNRGRTAPAVAAVLAAVAGSVAVGTFVASQDKYDELHYTAQAPPGAVVVQGLAEGTEEQVQQVLQRTFGGTPIIVRALGYGDLGAEDGIAEIVVPEANRCPADSLQNATQEEVNTAEQDPRCLALRRPGFLPASMVGGPDLVAAVSTRSPATDRILAQGGVAVPPLFLAKNGTVTVRVSSPTSESTARAQVPERTLVLPAAALPADAELAAIYSPEAARKVGVPMGVWGALAQPDAVPPTAVEDALRTKVQAISPDPYVYVERGYVSEYGLGLLALVIGSGVIVLGASGIATGLAAADGRSDLSTLAAVGASPGLRRRLAAFQSAVTAVLGTALGIVAGLVPALGLIRAMNVGRGISTMPTVIPWSSLAATALIVPLLAALAAALLTRSQLPLQRRVA